jgi:hypothetical protein
LVPSILIAAGGIIVAWLAGVRAKFFALSGLAMIAFIANSNLFFKTLSKI